MYIIIIIIIIIILLIKEDNVSLSVWTISPEPKDPPPVVMGTQAFDLTYCRQGIADRPVGANAGRFFSVSFSISVVCLQLVMPLVDERALLLILKVLFGICQSFLGLLLFFRLWVKRHTAIHSFTFCAKYYFSVTLWLAEVAWLFGSPELLIVQFIRWRSRQEQTVWIYRGAQYWSLALFELLLCLFRK